jgi:enamine deaminase RidA (YjgF/YER057c/UK114 family)
LSIQVVGYVASDPSFSDQPKVINGASDFLVDVFGDKGSHARSAVGVAALPLNVPVEVEMIVEIE